MESQPQCNNVLLVGCILCCLSLLLLGLPARGITVPKHSFTLLCHVSLNLSKIKIKSEIPFLLFIQLNFFQFLVTNITFNGWFYVCLWADVCQSVGCSSVGRNRESAFHFQVNYWPGSALKNFKNSYKDIEDIIIS